MNIIDTATALALHAHEGQTRKESSVPYIVHPVKVAIILSRYGFDDVVISAGLVHDVVEDTSVSLEEVSLALGEGVAVLVDAVSHNDNAPSWREKKEAYIESVRAGSVEAKAIATADKIANAQSFIDMYEKEGSEAWRYFNAGREQKLWFEHAMLAMLQQSWEHPLVNEYAEYIEKLEASV